MNARSLVLPLLFSASVLVLFFAFGFSIPDISLANPEPMPAMLSQKYDALTIAFKDPVVGYSFRYPIGYPLDVQDGQTASFYAPGDEGLSESFVWQVVNDSFGLNDLKQSLADWNASLVSQKTVMVDGKAATRLEYDFAADQLGTPARVIQGYIPCGNRSLFLAATIPQSLSQDADLADYTLFTAQCGQMN